MINENPPINLWDDHGFILKHALSGRSWIFCLSKFQVNDEVDPERLLRDIWNNVPRGNDGSLVIKVKCFEPHGIWSQGQHFVRFTPEILDQCTIRVI